MGLKGTDEFRQDAVRIALTSGLTRKQVADDLGVGMSTLNKWITAHRDTDVVSKEGLSLAQENDRLRRANRILMEERGRGQAFSTDAVLGCPTPQCHLLLGMADQKALTAFPARRALLVSVFLGDTV